MCLAPSCAALVPPRAYHTPWLLYHTQTLSHSAVAWQYARVSPILGIKVGPLHCQAIIPEGSVAKVRVAVVDDLVLGDRRPALLFRLRPVCRGGLFPLSRLPTCAHPRELTQPLSSNIHEPVPRLLEAL